MVVVCGTRPCALSRPADDSGGRGYVSCIAQPGGLGDCNFRVLSCACVADSRGAWLLADQCVPVASAAGPAGLSRGDVARDVVAVEDG
eukprot:447723-Heterocapsa_arctica.AAC.1